MSRTSDPNLEDLPGYAPESLKIADKIIKCLLIGVAVPAFLLSSRGLYYLIKGGVSYYFRKSDFHREIKRLKKRGYVALTKTPDGWGIRLFKKAKRLQQRIQIEAVKLPIQNKWDGKWRILIFDIPERNRYTRDLIRKKLKQLGMYNVQRSVFVYPYDCRKELEFIVDLFQLTAYTCFVESYYLDIDKELRRHFVKILK